ncbi:MAG: hypothetical protein WD992_02570 [Candidatus Levyibacteriota bacterium]
MKKRISIDKLVVNPENYRFDSVDTQDQAIDLMLTEKGEEILSLADHISRFGLDISKDLRVLKRESRYLILDGNRRITALKCLNDPTIIKNDNLRKEFEKLKNKAKNLPRKVNSFVYPDEDAASEWIRLDHTGKNKGAGQDPWLPPAQERFDYKFGGKFSPAMQAANLLRRNGLSVDEKKMKVTTINRIFSNPRARSFLGIDFKKGELSIVSNEREVISRLKALFDKIIKDDVTVKEVYDSDKVESFMVDLFGKELKKISTSIEKKEKINNLNKSKDKENKQESLDIFIVMAFAGLDDIYKAIKEVAESTFKTPNVFRIDYRSGAKKTQDNKIEDALSGSGLVIAVLAMGDKEKAVYDAIKNSENPEKILKKFFPINHNVLLELGYALRCVKLSRKDLIILVDDSRDGNLPNLADFSMNSFFDIRNRSQTKFSDIKDLKIQLKKDFLRNDFAKKYLR